jgi:hypothetical protein
LVEIGGKVVSLRTIAMGRGQVVRPRSILCIWAVGDERSSFRRKVKLRDRMNNLDQDMVTIIASAASRASFLLSSWMCLSTDSFRNIRVSRKYRWLFSALAPKLPSLVLA